LDDARSAGLPHGPILPKKSTTPAACPRRGIRPASPTRGCASPAGPDAPEVRRAGEAIASRMR